MTSKLTREQATDTEIQMLIDSHEKGTAMFLRVDAYYLMAKELQERRKAERDSEPVAWIVHARTGDQLTTDGGYVANAEGILGLHSTPLYRNAQPAPTARMVVIPTIRKHYTAAKTATIYEKAMTDAGIEWRSIDD
ncbi:hypothetical protein [Klebsiella oxytoca]|uniref:hypothetical protein n=1 Tax=Klebsiella oxytoca TaxID=571 RepID=UPI00190EB37B|nr:hypothetical protein [Klebsiella oxytoca]MBZ7483160.1 hypothetical protein [Klebsiella oxytoca]